MSKKPKEMELQDIDLDSNYEECFRQLQDPRSSNFVMIFDTQQASCAVNVSPGKASSILEDFAEDEVKRPCLWLNLWGWSPEHEEIVRNLARHYEVSPRLTHLLCPKTNRAPKAKIQVETTEKAASYQNADLLDSTSGSYSSETVLQKPVQPKRRMPTGIADIANDLWHFCTVDFGRRYICICWNALFFLPEDYGQTYIGKPRAVRVWSSLLLCDDGTVVSTFECPAGLTPKATVAIRNNQLNVFTHLSKYGAQNSGENALMQIAIRPFHSPEGSASSLDNSNMAHLLFYYLFDDWLNIYYQAIGAENSYRNQLETLRRRMIDSAEVEQVTTLHQIGRELGVLRAVYLSYESIIERIVQKHRRPMARATLTHQSASDLTRKLSFHDSIINDTNDISNPDMQLGASTIARFERLRDRIALCAMTEVDECLKEKDDLVWMNFNLVTLKESQAVEKLTRVTVLLAKVTILFLPISLTTAYFSMQFSQINDLYSLKTYWVSFLIVALLTIILLLGFGVLSDRYQGKIVYRSLTKTFLKGRRRPRTGKA